MSFNIDTIGNYYNEYSTPINTHVNSLLWPIDQRDGSLISQIGSLVLKLILVLYGGVIAPKLPYYVLEWFDFVPFKIFILFLICWLSSEDPSLSILLALGFYISVNLLNGKKALEKFKQRRN
jgi:hypothetical protein